jgi:hypothetical protein
MKENDFLNRGISKNEGLTVYSYIPRYMVIKSGMKRDMPEDMELEILKQRNSDNHNKHPIRSQIIYAVRLKMRVKEKNEEGDREMLTWNESRACGSPNLLFVCFYIQFE